MALKSTAIIIENALGHLLATNMSVPSQLVSPVVGLSRHKFPKRNRARGESSGRLIDKWCTA